MKTVIVIGAGGRGTRYSDIMADYGEKFKIVAVAEPVDVRRNYIKDKFELSDDTCHLSWEEFLSRPKFADLVVIATMDRQHYAPAMAAIEKGYDILLEKPMSATPEECIEIAKAAKAKGVFVQVCHVLRFTPFFKALKDIIDSGRIGEIIHIQHAEDVGNVHQSHSFVRGNWRNSDESSCMILQKSCHDMDILAWLIGKKCKKVSSFGSLSYFRPENAPEGAPMRCTDGCPHSDTCYYDAVKIYRDQGRDQFYSHMLLKRNEHGTDEEIVELLKTEPYGRCVFHCDNNVVDHQAVNLEFEGGATVSFSMAAFNRGGRYIRVMGTKGEISAKMSKDGFELYDFATRETTHIDIPDAILNDSIDGGHGGGDGGIIKAVAARLDGDTSSKSLCTIEETCRNHLIAFAAEESRVTGKVIDMEEYEKSLGGI
ncbi:MAG: Gfo/Idh/MocA family oxidoreductase [Ruminococcaceae bacterium]|nr:Gfo/Idh/MocA family oxidoreductase [Oscillospiraceae bacterium]